MSSCHGLYIHIPFCKSKCPYCDFYSLPYDEQLSKRYTTAVKQALALAPFGMQTLDTVYFGGGTPSILGGKRIAELLAAVKQHFAVSADAEITVECNPDSASRAFFQEIRAAGANRISMGMQAADDTALRHLGRIHQVRDIVTAVEHAKKEGISNISLDLMLATSGQTRAQISDAVTLCSSLGVGHVSAYLLKIEPDTPFAKRPLSDFPDEDAQVARYYDALELLDRHGYQQYEISNFARPEQQAKHNLKYWNAEEYLGIGPSAHSFINGHRRFFTRDINAFLAEENPFSRMVYDGMGGDMEEYLMLRLRLTQGVHWKTLRSRYPAYDQNALECRLPPLEKQGLIQVHPHGFRLTTQGFLLSNAVIGALLE